MHFINNKWYFSGSLLSDRVLTGVYLLFCTDYDVYNRKYIIF